eukprot:gene502-2979_t
MRLLPRAPAHDAARAAGALRRLCRITVARWAAPGAVDVPGASHR